MENSPRTKILIIGQASPAVKQGVPYDSTMLYEWFNELGISKEKAQELFDFDAVYDKFPGRDGGGHKKPTEAQMEDYWQRSLKDKVLSHNKILIFGNVAHDFLMNKKEIENRWVAKTIHPSRLNFNLYNKNKNQILNTIKSLL